jgi:hypothetical protein
MPKLHMAKDVHLEINILVNVELAEITFYVPMRADLKIRPRNLDKGSGTDLASAQISTYPSLFRSTRRGATARAYVQVQINSKIVSRRDWKLNNADCDNFVSASNTFEWFEHTPWRVGTANEKDDPMGKLFVEATWQPNFETQQQLRTF